MSASQELHRLVARAHGAKSVAEVIGAVMDCSPEIVGAAVTGCYRSTATSFEIDQVGAPDALALRYGEFVASAVDPIHTALMERHIAVRSNELYSPEEWRNHPFCKDVEAEFDLDAYMAAELLDCTGQCGVLGVARKVGAPPFSNLDAQYLQTICLHASVALTRLTNMARRSVIVHLTEKQRELVRLVASGLTNTQIACAQGVTTHAIKRTLERLFERTQVSSRAELVARLGHSDP